MKHHIAKYLLGILVVVAQLRATVVVGIRDDGIHTLAASLLTQALGQLVGNAIDTTYSGDNPHLVAHTHIAILATIAFEGQSFVGDIQLHLHGVIGIVEQACQVGLDLILVDPLSLLHILGGMTDGVTILDDVLAFVQVGQHHLVSGRGILQYVDILSVNSDCFSSLQ